MKEILSTDSKLGTVNGFDENDLNVNLVLDVSSDAKTPYVTHFIFSKSARFTRFSLINNEVWGLKCN